MLLHLEVGAAERPVAESFGMTGKEPVGILAVYGIRPEIARV